MKCILVVDDDDQLRDVVAAVLSQDGYAVDSARDGAEALAWLDQEQYDLILSDLQMPGLDGPGLYEALQMRSRWPTHHVVALPRVIFMTGNATAGAYADFLTRTTEPMLEKPFNLTLLRQVVKVLLEGSALVLGSQHPGQSKQEGS